MSCFSARIVNDGRLTKDKEDKEDKLKIKKRLSIWKHFHLLYSPLFNVKNSGLPIFHQLDSCQNFPTKGANPRKWN